MRRSVPQIILANGKLAPDPESDLAPQSLYNAAYGSMALKDYANGLKLAEQSRGSLQRLLVLLEPFINDQTMN